MGEVLDFFGLEGAAYDRLFAVGEPLLEELGAAEFVLPDVGGDALPVCVGFVVRIA